jgi:tetratricopeptide (TPR) repeat protein
VAESRYLRVRAIQRDAGDTSAAATASIGLGNLAVDRGRWALAEEQYDEAEAWVARLAPGAPERWHLALNRAIVARETGDLDAAERHQDAAESACGAVPEPEAHAILSNARGQLLSALGRLEQAEFAFRRALTSAESSGARVTIAVNLAMTLLELGNSLEAGQLLREAEERAIGGGAIPRLPEVYRALGRVAAARGHADAFVFFERALELGERHGLPAYERARTLVDYGRFDMERGEADAGRARLEEASSIFQELGSAVEHTRTLSILEGDSPEEPPSGVPSDG